MAPFWVLLPLFFLANSFVFSQAAVYDEDGWKAASKFLSEAIDTSVNPCKNFYQFACGKWQKTYKGKFIGEPQKTIKSVADNLMDAIKRIDVENPATPAYQKSLRTFFDQCVDAPVDYNVALTGIYNLSAKLFGHMPLLNKPGIRPKNPYYLIGKMPRFINTAVFVGPGVMASQEKCETTPQLTLIPSIKPNTLMKLNESTFTDKLMALADSLGYVVREEKISARIKELVELEKNISIYVENLQLSEPVRVVTLCPKRADGVRIILTGIVLL